MSQIIKKETGSIDDGEGWSVDISQQLERQWQNYLKEESVVIAKNHLHDNPNRYLYAAIYFNAKTVESILASVIRKHEVYCTYDKTMFILREVLSALKLPKEQCNQNISGTMYYHHR